MRNGKLALTIWLENDPSKPIEIETVDLPEDVLAEADQILAAFAMADGTTPKIEFKDW